MLKSKLIHPKIMGALALCGHGDRILIVDGNYPLDSASNINATKVYLGLEAGTPTVTKVLKVLKTAINIEEVTVMSPDEGEVEPEIFDDFREVLPDNILQKIDRFKFYEEAKYSDNIKLAISTGELRTYGCLILTVGIQQG